MGCGNSSPTNQIVETTETKTAKETNFSKENDKAKSLEKDMENEIESIEKNDGKVESPSPPLPDEKDFENLHEEDPTSLTTNTPKNEPKEEEIIEDEEIEQKKLTPEEEVQKERNQLISDHSDDNVYVSMIKFAEEYGPKKAKISDVDFQFFLVCKLSCAKLKKVSGNGVVIQVYNESDNIVGCTNWVKTCSSPSFDEPVFIPFLVAKEERYTFKVYKIESKKDFEVKKQVQEDKDQLVGEISYNVTEIKREMKKTLMLGKKKCGDLLVRAPELRCVKSFPKKLNFKDEKVLLIKLVGKDLEKCDTLGKSDPYFQIFKYGIFEGKEQLFQSEIIKNTLNPLWKPFSLIMDKMGSGKRMRKLHLICYDWNRYNEDDLIGSFDFSPKDIEEDKKFVLKIKGNQKNRGTVIIDNVEESKVKVRVDKPKGKEKNIMNLLEQSGYIKAKEYKTLNNQVVEIWSKFMSQDKSKSSVKKKTGADMQKLNKNLKFGIQKKQTLGDLKKGRKKKRTTTKKRNKRKPSRK